MTPQTVMIVYYYCNTNTNTTNNNNNIPASALYLTNIKQRKQNTTGDSIQP